MNIKDSLSCVLFIATSILLTFHITANEMEELKENPYVIKHVPYLLQYYNIKFDDINPNIKTPLKRIVLTEETFNSLPYGLKFRQVGEVWCSNLIMKDPNGKTWKKGDDPVITGNSPRYFRILIEDESSELGANINIAYSPTLDKCRKELFAEMLNNTMFVQAVAECNKPCKEKIGDDLCFIDSRTGNDRILFIRQNTLFVIGLASENEKNLLEFAKYIDKKYVELNKKLNEEAKAKTDATKE